MYKNFTKAISQIPKSADTCILLKTKTKPQNFQINISNINKDKKTKLV